MQDILDTAARDAQGSVTPPADYLDRNRAAWDRWATGHLAAGRKAWQETELRWGIWGVPESRISLLRGIEPGADVIELGCGTADVSAWLARRGVRPVAVDISSKQVHNVESLQHENDIRFPVICCNAEEVQYEKASFDYAISEYGASLWCDPQRWVAEANRLLRPDGRLIFVTNSAFLMACTPESGGLATEQLVRSYFARPRVEFDDHDGPVEFHLNHSNWIRLLVANGFAIEDLAEIRPPSGAKARFELASIEWARKWPTEDVWIARKTA